MLVEAFRYNRWANLLLLDTCGNLTAEQLELTSPGTYGSIAATLTHLVGAERRYLWRLTGSAGHFSQHRIFPGIATLKAQAAESGAGLIEIAPRIRRGETVELNGRKGTYRVEKSVILIQALHHGNDHRTHVCTILGAHNIAIPEMDVWAYGEAVARLASC